MEPNEKGDNEKLFGSVANGQKYATKKISLRKRQKARLPYVVKGNSWSCDPIFITKEHCSQLNELKHDLNCCYQAKKMTCDAYRGKNSTFSSAEAFCLSAYCLTPFFTP